MRRAYVVTGERHDGIVVAYYGICHSMQRAALMCDEAAEDTYESNLVYSWHEVIEEDD